MKPLAIIPVFNEADVLPSVLSHLTAQGCELYVLDNWSTDSSAEIARKHGATVERWPATEPRYYEWSAMLQRIEEIAAGHPGRWIIFHDADEVRRPPLQLPATLAAALAEVELAGSNAIDHDVLTFAPIDDSYASRNLEEHFRHYAPDHVDRCGPHIKSWIQPAWKVDLHSSGGHQVRFPGRSVCPIPFLLKHYPIRSQAHGERKVFKERLPRYSPEERRRMWHVQYDRFSGATPQFVRRPEELIRYRRPVSMVTLTGFEDIFKQCIAPSADQFEPARRKIVVTSRGSSGTRRGWISLAGREPFCFAANLNQGIRAAGNDCDVLCVNDDVTLTAPLIAQLQAVLDRDPEIGIVTPKVDGGINLLEACVECRTAGEYTLTTPYIPFVCVLLRREMLDQIGLLDESFDGYGGDDVEYCRRAMGAGFKMAVSSQATVRHGHGGHRFSSSFLRVMTPQERSESMARMNQRAEAGAA